MLVTNLFGSRKHVVAPLHVALTQPPQILSSVCAPSILKVLPAIGSDQSKGVAGVERFGVVHLQTQVCTRRQQFGCIYCGYLLRVFTGVDLKIFY